MKNLKFVVVFSQTKAMHWRLSFLNRPGFPGGSIL